MDKNISMIGRTKAFKNVLKLIPEVSKNVTKPAVQKICTYQYEYKRMFPN